MPENEYIEPKTNYVAGDQVTPTIFNNLGQSIKYIYEIRCPVVMQASDGTETRITEIVLVEV